MKPGSEGKQACTALVIITHSSDFHAATTLIFSRRRSSTNTRHTRVRHGRPVPGPCRAQSWSRTHHALPACGAASDSRSPITGGSAQRFMPVPAPVCARRARSWGQRQIEGAVVDRQQSRPGPDAVALTSARDCLASLFDPVHLIIRMAEQGSGVLSVRGITGHANAAGWHV